MSTMPSPRPSGWTLTFRDQIFFRYSATPCGGMAIPYFASLTISLSPTKDFALTTVAQVGAVLRDELAEAAAQFAG